MNQQHGRYGLGARLNEYLHDWSSICCSPAIISRVRARICRCLPKLTFSVNGRGRSCEDDRVKGLRIICLSRSRNASGALLVESQIFGKPHAVRSLITDGKFSGYALRPVIGRQPCSGIASNSHVNGGLPLAGIDS